MISKSLILFFGNIKLLMIKLLHFRHFKYNLYNNVSLFSKITVKKTGEIKIGKKFILRKNCTISANDGKIIIGNNCGFNNNCYMVAHDFIKFGDNVDIGPNCVIVDHDHDYKKEFSSKDRKNYYKTSEIEIGNNVWIGANCVILRGSKIGDNVVIGAGTIVNSEVPNNTILVDKKEKKFIELNK